MSSGSSFSQSTPTCAQRPPRTSANGHSRRRVDRSSKSKKKGLSRRQLPQPRFEESESSSSPEGEDEDEPTAPTRKRQRQDEPSDADDEDRNGSNSRSDCELEGNKHGGCFPFIDRRYWRSKGKILGRCIEMWDTFNGILNQGASRNPDVDEDSIHTEFQNQQYKKFLLLLEVTPVMGELLESVGSDGGQAFTRELHAVIDIGRQRARRVDVNGIRCAIVQWPGIIWEPAFPVMRHLLGFNHATTGELLCPATLDWSDLGVRERLRRGIEEVTAADLPAFLWPKGIFSAEDPYNGFLRGPLLVMAYKHIFISPSSAKEANKSTRGGNAALHNIQFVTFESIAYVATITRFALSDEATFNPGGPGPNNTQRPGFPNRDFYRELLEHKSVMSSENLLSSLIHWWDGIIFPRTVYTSGQVKADSVGAMMRERVKAKRLEAARQTTQPAAQATTSGAAATTAATATSGDTA